MSSASFSVSEYLAASRKAFLASPSDWTIVSGNGAGDLDSVASSISYAYLASGGDATKRLVPLIRTARDDFKLRPENVEALKESGIDKSILLCLDDLPKPLSELSEPSYVLVDYNVFEGGPESPKVTGVIDHHVNEGRYPNASPRIIKLAGSCSSLVATHFSNADIPREIADLLIGAILIDTGNLKPAPKGKAEDVDRQAMDILLPRSSFNSALSVLAATNKSQSRQQLNDRFQRLITLKSDVGDVRAHTHSTDAQLSPRDLLRRDFKSFKSPTGYTIGMSTVPLSIRDAFGSDLLGALSAYADELGLDAEFSLNSYQADSTGSRAREIAAFVRNDALRQALLDDLADSTREALDLTARDSTDRLWTWSRTCRSAAR